MKTLLLITRFCLFLILVFGVLYTPERSHTAQVDSEIRTLIQPDGTSFSARAFGDERRYWVETIDEYTIVKNQQGYWTYAVRNAADWLSPTALIVGKETPPERFGIPKQLRPIVPLAGIEPLPVVLLITFPDVTPVRTADSFKAQWFGPDSPISVTGWYTAVYPLAYYGEDVVDDHGNRLRDRHTATLVIEAVKAADAAIDFSRYDKDSDCYVDLVMVVHQGFAQEETAHEHDLFSLPENLNDAVKQGDGSGEVITNDSCHSLANSHVKVNAYSMQPEIRFLLRY